MSTFDYERALEHGGRRDRVECAALKYAAAPCGWYACQCGAVGFKAGLDSSGIGMTEVDSCPRCFRN